MAKKVTIDLDFSEEFPHLASAPIVEAVIHVSARAETQWHREETKKDLTERLSDYPVCQFQHALELETQFDAGNSSTTQIRRDTWQGFRFTSTDKVQIVQFNRDGFVFSRLKPYENWMNFEREALRLWGLFVELGRPSQVQRLGVRFINRIAVESIDEVRRTLVHPPKCLQPVGMPSEGFLFQSKHSVPGHPMGVNVVQTFQPATPANDQGPGLILDLDVFTMEPFEYEEARLTDYLPKMRWLKNKAFFSLLKDKVIQRFKEANP